MSSANLSTTGRRGWRRFIRRSTLINFAAILVIFGVILILHKSGSDLLAPGDDADAAAASIATDTEQVTEAANAEEPAIVEKETYATVDMPDGETVTETKEIHALPALAPIEIEEEVEVKAEAEAEAEFEVKVKVEGAEAEKPKVAAKPRVTTRRRGRLYRVRRSSHAADREYSVEALDNEAARRRYMEASRRPIESDLALESRGAASTRGVYTSIETPAHYSDRTYAYDDLDGTNARKRYREQNEKLSTVDLR